MINEKFRAPLFPSPLRGGVRGGGPQMMTDMVHGTMLTAAAIIWKELLTEIQSALTPTPDPSPQGGGEKKPRRPRQSRRPRKELN
jgi:hypothetical protein